MRSIWYSGDAGGHALEPIDLAHRDRVRPLSGSFASSIRLRSSRELVAFAFAELLLDRLQLLAQVVLPLRVGHLLLRLRLDLALQLEQRDLARERRRDRLQLLRAGRSSSSSCLLLVRLHVEQLASR